MDPVWGFEKLLLMAADCEVVSAELRGGRS